MGGDLHAQIAPGHHDAVGGGDDALQVLNASRFPILAMMRILSPPCLRSSARMSSTSLALRTKEAAMKSKSLSTANFRSSVLVGEGGQAECAHQVC